MAIVGKAWSTGGTGSSFLKAKLRREPPRAAMRTAVVEVFVRSLIPLRALSWTGFDHPKILGPVSPFPWKQFFSLRLSVYKSLRGPRKTRFRYPSTFIPRDILRGVRGSTASFGGVSDKQFWRMYPGRIKDHNSETQFTNQDIMTVGVVGTE